jgi:RNA polymerase sigma factor (sigma-70 family)
MIRARAGRLSASSLSADDVNEIVQETLCRAIQAQEASRYDGSRDLLPYLAGISFNVLSDLRRARSRHSRHSAMLEALELHSSDPGASELDIEREFDLRPELVRGWLAQQSPTVQELCHRRFWLGESQRVAAATLNLSRQQVRTLERQIRSSLSRHLIHAGEACGSRVQ